MTPARASIVLLACVAALVVPSIGRAQPVTVTTESGEVSIVADRVESIGPDNLIVATGNAEVSRGTSRLLADRIEINQATGDATAYGRIIFYDGDTRLSGERIDFNFKTGMGVVYEGEGHAPPYYRISGERLERIDESVYRMRPGVFTTCEDEVPEWSFRLGSATADLEDFVWGTNVSFWVKWLPLLPYFPAFAAPIRRERQTGFLVPVFGSSSRKGVYGEIPFYLVISDSQDATLTFAVYQKLGFGAAGEYRYVISKDQRGALDGAFVSESFKDGALRGYGSGRHEWQIAPGLALRADLNGVSDDLVLRDYAFELER